MDTFNKVELKANFCTVGAEWFKGLIEDLKILAEHKHIPMEKRRGSSTQFI